MELIYLLNVRKALKDTEEIFRAYLGLKNHLVGVKLEKDGEALEVVSKPEMPMAFCQIVRAASFRGDKFIHGLENENCPIAQIALGLKSLKYFKTDYRTVPSGTKRILVSPLSEIDVFPDVALAILTPRQMMNLAMIFHAVEGKPLSSEFTGEHACAEFFAKPYVDGEPNISFLCNAARGMYSDYRDNETIFGAPIDVYIRVSEMVKKLDEIGGSMCGCRTSNMPSGVIEEFEKIGFSKGTDYFFGRLNGLNVKVYINKDARGIIKLITIHLPIKMSSQREAEEIAERLRNVLPSSYLVNARGRWLDLAVRSGIDALGIDLFERSSIKSVIERFVDEISLYLNKARI